MARKGGRVCRSSGWGMEKSSGHGSDLYALRLGFRGVLVILDICALGRRRDMH